MTPEGKVKLWCRKPEGAFDKVFPGHARVSPRGGVYAAGGVADDLLCWQGLFIAIEIKCIDGTATVLQMQFLQSIIRAGGIAVILRGPDLVRLHLARDKALRILSMRYPPT